MPAPKANFLSVSEEVAARFLHTVVVFDDKAFLHKNPAKRNPGKLVKPSRVESGKNSKKNENWQSYSIGSEDELDAKKLIDLFAEKGLICSILVPGRSEDPVPKTVSAARRSDIVVLDWRIHDDNGEITTRLIDEILKDDGSGESRLRVIAIYTAEPDLHSVVAKAKDELRKHHSDYPLVEDGFTLTRGPVRIAVYAKEGTLVGTQELRKRIVRLRDLPKKLISEFSLSTMGLISNVALESLAAVRANTHQILTKFHGELDAAYLTHRALLEPPDEAELHLIPLVLSEIQAVLEDRNVAKQVAIENIGKWLDFRIGNGLKLYRNLKMRSRKKARQAILEIAEKGIRDKTLADSYPQIKIILDGLREETPKKALNEFTKLLISNGGSALEFDRELALLMSVRSRYESPIPILTLGSIIAEDVENSPSRYWLCVQPVCDSVRLKDKRNFPFLKMTKAPTEAAFNYVVKDRVTWVELNLQLRPHESRMISFKPRSGEREIRAAKESSEWFFQAVDSERKKYRWIAELKTEHSQRVANDYSNQMSRVGLMESEWLRRWAKK
jgi:hypothetical protein